LEKEAIEYFLKRLT